MSETGYVYTLNDPRTSEPKYVGASKNPRQRLSVIVSKPHNDGLEAWIEELEEDGLSPDMSLVRVADIEDLERHEKEVLDDIAANYDVLNVDLEPSYHGQQEGTSQKGSRPLLRDKTTDVLEEIADEHEYSSLDRAITHVLREQGYEL